MYTCCIKCKQYESSNQLYLRTLHYVIYRRCRLVSVSDFSFHIFLGLTTAHLSFSILKTLSYVGFDPPTYQHPDPSSSILTHMLTMDFPDLVEIPSLFNNDKPCWFHIGKIQRSRRQVASFPSPGCGLQI
jgi:hypothetical protein